MKGKSIFGFIVVFLMMASVFASAASSNVKDVVQISPGDVVVTQAVGAAADAVPATTATSPYVVACTMDAKMCPDGTYVGRVAPYCEFAPCTKKVPVCGDGVCDDSERSKCSTCPSPAPGIECTVACSITTCPQDCSKTEPVCGNGICETGEADIINICPEGTACKPSYKGTCPADCTAKTPVCGNGICEGDEGGICPSCVGSTGPCPACIPGTCLKDCETKTAVCGNGVCEAGEASFCPACTKSKPACAIACRVGTCPNDCEKTPVCGDGVCDDAERGSCTTCPSSEPNCVVSCSISSCPKDCSKTEPVCGNGVCEDGETGFNDTVACPPGAQCMVARNIYCPQDCPTTTKCRKESEMCGGIAGFRCCDGMTCELSGTYPDASGKCVKGSECAPSKCADGSIAKCMRDQSGLCVCTCKAPNPERPVCMYTGTEKEGWYIGDKLVKYDSCACTAVCMGGGPEGEGYYNTCTHTLIQKVTCAQHEPIHVAVKSKTVDITQNTETSTMEIRAQNSTIGATTSEKITYADNKLQITTDAGAKELKVLPEEAKATVIGNGQLSTVTGMRLVQENNIPVYEIDGTKKTYILWIFPSTASATVKVNAETNQVIG